MHISSLRELSDLIEGSGGTLGQTMSIAKLRTLTSIRQSYETGQGVGVFTKCRGGQSLISVAGLRSVS